jgi:hypothetical protein
MTRFLHAAIDQVDHRNVWPNPRQTFRHEAAVAAIRGRFAAQQATRLLGEYGLVDGRGDATRVHERLEAGDVALSVVVLAVGVADCFGWGQDRKMDVVRADEAAQEPGKVLLLGEPGELPAGIEADIHHPLNAVLGQESKNRSADFWVKPMV